MKQCIKIKVESFAQLVDEINTLDSKKMLDWSYLSKNLNSEIDIELFYSIYKEKIDWCVLSENTTVNFTEEFIIKHKDSINWSGTKTGSYHKYGLYSLGGFSHNPSFPINTTFIDKVIDYVDWRSLGMNPSFKIFDPEEVYGLDHSSSDYYHQTPIFEVINKYWNKWEKKGSFFVADLVSGSNKDSIYDNPNIDWNFFNKNKSNYNVWIDWYKR